MSNYKHDHNYEASLALNVPDSPGEIKTISHTDKALSITLKRFTSTINQFGALSQTLSNKIEGLNSRFDDIERYLDSIENRIDSIKQSIDKVKFKSVNEYLLEVIRREQRVIKEFGDLVSRYQEQEI
ncbi:uncharacterized protein N7525_011127 [Penicillium rubens]|uniref:uncharacterized protein n=1 Tax=Penicillium rubens TaxID=1108849 RepID=UPI002A599327|nr:uncharacterized protein N7525_011127 [Penicillium rubens]KAJ5821843.1 hypothetical protein N7525_011127 [Penicillium rubens]